MALEILAGNADAPTAGRLIPFRPLTRRQQAAIRTEAATGDHIRADFPQIAEEYRMGLTAPRLVDRHGLDAHYGVSRRAAVAAVRNALRGYSGPFYQPYEGLISDRSERTTLALAHSRHTGIEAYQQKRGLHALTSEQKAEAGRKGGLILGAMSYRLRFGCHAIPPEVQREHLRKIAHLGARKGAIACVLSRGLTLYAPGTGGRCSEVEFAESLASDPEFQTGPRIKMDLIAKAVNLEYHGGKPVRNAIGIRAAIQRYRRQMRVDAGRNPGHCSQVQPPIANEGVE